MSIIPMILTPPHATVVLRVENFDPNGQAILIRNFDDTQDSRPDGDGNVCYDLRVGSQYRDHREEGGRSLREGETIDLLPNLALIIQTLEEVQFPRLIFGQIVPKVTLLQQRVASTPTKVDLGYNGRLLVTVFNHGKRAAPLQYGQKFCAMFLLSVDDRVVPYNKPSQQISGVGRRKLVHRVRDFMERNIALITSALFVTQIIYLLVDVFG
ncbi:MAG: hypothetical protein WD673_12160 [Alphaproteobacteria bacterium]